MFGVKDFHQYIEENGRPKSSLWNILRPKAEQLDADLSKDNWQLMNLSPDLNKQAWVLMD